MIVLAAGVAGPAAAQAQPNVRAGNPVFARADYESYFKPGRFATYSPFYSSDGVMEVVTNIATAPAGQHRLRQATKSFDVSPNYDVASVYPWYKIRATHTEDMIWDPRQAVYRYEYAPSEFGADKAVVWESKDQTLAVSPGDRSWGDLHQFYRDADKRAGQNPKELEDDFKQTIIGQWTWRCIYLAEHRFEVECKATHLASQHVETFYYRRLEDLTS